MEWTNPNFLDPEDPRLHVPEFHGPASSSETNRTNYLARLSSTSSLLSPSTQTSTDLQPDLAESSQSATTRTHHDAYRWNYDLSHPSSPAVDGTPDPSLLLSNALLSSNGLLSQLPHTSVPNNDNDGELTLVPLTDSPQATFDLCVTRLRRQFAGHGNPEAYAFNLFQFVISQEPLNTTSAIPSEIQVPHEDPPLNIPSSPRASRGLRPPLYACMLCRSRQLITSRGALKRHVSYTHSPKSEFRCDYRPCTWKNYRRDKLLDHHRRHDFHRQWTRGDILRCEFRLPFPTRCEICFRAPPFQSWDEWFECIEGHCRLPNPQPSSTADLPDAQNRGGMGGAGFGGGFSFGAAGAGGGRFRLGERGNGGMSFMGNTGGPQQYWPTNTFGSTLHDEPPCDDTGATEKDDIPEGHSGRSIGLSDDSFSLHKKPVERGKLGIKWSDVPKSPSAEDSMNHLSGKCRRCGHMPDSCSACPPDRTPADWCHKCDKPPLWTTYKSLTCKNPTSWKPTSTSIQKMTGMPSATLRLSLSVISTLNRTILIFFVMQSENFVQARRGRQRISSVSAKELSAKTVIDALAVGQKTLDRIHRNPHADTQVTMQNMHRCHLSLDAIQVELTVASNISPSSGMPRRQLSRRKRLSALWARLRAVAFLLALQNTISAPNTRMEENKPKSVGDNWLEKPEWLNASPFTASEIGTLQTWCWTIFGLLYKHASLVQDMLQDTKPMLTWSKIQDSSYGICSLLGMLVTTMSDTTSPFSTNGSTIDELYPVFLNAINSNVALYQGVKA